MRNDNKGFTLVELLVSISVAALVTLAAASLLLLGTRIQHISTKDAAEQNTVRVVMTLLEDMAGSGQIHTIESTYGGWLLKDQDGQVLFEYVATEQAVYRGKNETAGVPLLTGLNNASVTMDGKMMKLSFETDRGDNYVTRIYCRQGIDDVSFEKDTEVDAKVNAYGNENKDTIEGNWLSAEAFRLGFLETVASQYGGGNNGGIILDVDHGTNTGEYYSEWYLKHLYNSGYGSNPGWNRDTPWCACFVSWAAVESGALDADEKQFVFANVNRGVEIFRDENLWQDADGTEIVTPGDYIFFDWTGKKSDPAHVGVVLDSDGSHIYTIEGNSSGRVAVRRYDRYEDDIMGYGTLPRFLH